MIYYFLQEDLEQLDNRIAELKNKIKEFQEDKHLATTQTSETWHDNYGFEEGVRQINQITNTISELLAIKEKAKIIKEIQSDKVEIGSTVKFKDESDKEYIVKIGSYFVINSQNTISYNSPLGKILLGTRKGEIRTGIIGGKEKRFIITNIALKASP